MRDKIAKIVMTVFGIGYLPIMSGTYASAAGSFIYFLLRSSSAWQAAAACVVTAAGFVVTTQAERLFGKKDPGQVVIDELSGMLIAYLLIPFSISNLVLGFFIFRAFDILKVPPANSLERLPGGYGIMLDDVSSGIMTNIILRVIMYARG